jgi:phosphopantetheinyl transferase
VDLWFTPVEKAWYRDAGAVHIGAYIWAAKEAIYKATNAGESFAPRDVEIRSDGQCHYRNLPLANCQLKSWSVDGHLAVLAIVRSPVSSNSTTTTIHCR